MQDNEMGERRQKPPSSQVAARERAGGKSTWPIAATDGPFPVIRVGTIKVQSNPGIFHRVDLPFLAATAKELE